MPAPFLTVSVLYYLFLYVERKCQNAVFSQFIANFTYFLNTKDVYFLKLDTCLDFRFDCSSFHCEKSTFIEVAFSGFSFRGIFLHQGRVDQRLLA